MKNRTLLYRNSKNEKKGKEGKKRSGFEARDGRVRAQRQAARTESRASDGRHERAPAAQGMARKNDEPPAADDQGGPPSCLAHLRPGP